MLKRDSEAYADAVIAFSSAEAVGALAGQLDAAFGRGDWIAAGIRQAGGLVRRIAAEGGRFLAIGVTAETEAEISAARDLIAEAKRAGLKVILLAESLSPSAMHALMRAGADDFAPLPLPQAALTECVARLRAGAGAGFGGARHGLIYPVYGAAGGVGATTFCVNLAWETALEVAKSDRRVALLDFNFQYGTVATYLDLPRREAIYELLSDTSTLDHEGFGQALAEYGGRMSVLTAPMDVLPLDIIGPEDVRTMFDLARANYDFIFIDLPQALTHWSDLVLTEAETLFAIMETDMRSAQNMLRFLRAVKAEDLPIEKISVGLNRAPRFTDMSGRSRARRLEQSLGVEFALRLPDGGAQVADACDQGAPLARAAKGNALRKEIRRLAGDLVKSAAAARVEAKRAR
ncbi:MAG: CpaE family protein [Pikeienuella sp.]